MTKAYTSEAGKELQSILPDIRTMLGALQTKEFNDYEAKLTKTTAKAMQVLDQLIDDGTLALDPEQAINAVKTLTQAKKDVLESRRRLLDTCIRGEVMIKSLEQGKNNKGDESSVLLDYINKNKLKEDETNVPEQKSIFESIADNNEAE